MYCSDCGLEVAGELNFCNRCGANLKAAANAPALAVAPINFTTLAIITATMLLLGIVVIFAVVDKMMDRGVRETAIVWLAMGGLATIFGVTALLLRLWSKAAGLSTSKPRPSQPNRQQVLPEPPRHTPLPPRPANFGSVTDNTTRTFDPIYRDTMEQQK